MKNQNAKNQNANQSSIPAKEDSLKSLLDGINLPESLKNASRELSYIFPEGWNKSHINGEEGKKFRGLRRRELKRISNNFFFGIKSDSPEMIEKSCNDWKKEYQFYSLQDYSLASIQLKKSWDEKESLFYSRFIEGMKKMNAK